MPDDPVQKRKLSVEVRDRLRRFIREDALQPGQALPSERELMRRFRVGRPAVREAMQGMERDGLIEIRHGDRARVSEPSAGRMIEQISESAQHLLSHSPANLENLKEARDLFEIELVRRAALACSEEDVERLWRRVEEQEHAIHDTARFLRCDGAFHRQIAEISGNPIFVAVSEAMFRWLSRFHVSLVRVPGCEELTLSEHQGIVEAIEAHSPELARKRMSDHLNRANKLYSRGHHPDLAGDP